MKYFKYLFVILIAFILVGCKTEKQPEYVEINFSGSYIEEYSEKVELGKVYTLPIPIREGYVFAGWEDLDTEEVYNGDITVNGYLFLDAKWDKLKRYTVTYDDGGKTIKTDYFYEGDEFEPYTPEKTGYTFKGWFFNSSFTKPYSKNDMTDKTTLFAKFEANVYTITFEKVSSNANKTKQVKYNERIGTMPSLSIGGCRFEGWLLNGERVYDYTVYTIDSDVTLTPILYATTTFYTSSTESSKIEYLVGVNPAVPVVKEGKTFGGWYLDQSYSGDAIFNITTTSYAGKALYAKWLDESTDDISQKLIQNAIDYYTSLLDGKYIYEDIDMGSKDPIYGVTTEWSTDNDKVSSNGKVTRIKENVKVNITCKFTYGNVTATASFGVILKEDIYKDISKNVIVSYCYTGTMSRRPVDDILLETCDVINLAFANAGFDGTFTMNVDYLAKFESFKEKAREAGVRVLICMGPPSGDGPKIFTTIAESDELRKKFASNIVNAINEYGFSGVDIDWEYPTSQQKGAYKLLMKEIYEQVKANNPEHLVTSAIPAGPYTYPNYGLKDSIQYLDYINMMSYDMESPSKATHHCALYSNGSTGTPNLCSIADTVSLWTAKSQSVPKEKIVIGAAFYSKRAVLSTSYTSPLNGSVASGEKYSGYNYDTVKNNLASGGDWKEYWDDKAKAPYAFNSKTKEFFTYDNPKSIGYKCDYLVSEGLRGIMWWDYGNDASGDLIQAVNAKLDKMKK